VLKDLRFVLEDVTKGFVAKLSLLVHEQLVGTKISTKAVETVVTSNVPGLLEEEFIASLLANDAAVERRAVLLHLVSTVQVQTFGRTGKARLRSTVAAVEVEDEEELTSEVAAKLLHVSRSHLNTLADSGVFGEIRRTEGGHRRIPKSALLEYRERSREHQAKGLDAMVEASQKLGLYADELAGVPRRSRR
jgi:excisionase family DNA binding protein